MSATDTADTDSTSQDPLRDFRQGTLDRMALIGYPFIVPFGLWHLYSGNYAVGGLMLLISATIAFRSIRGYDNDYDAFLAWLLTIELLVAMFFGYASVGVPATYWSYPLFFVIIFLWPREQSGPSIIVSLAVLLPAAYYYLDQEVAIRLSITLVLFCYMGYQLVGILIRMQDKLERQAMCDPLTGAYNRRQLNRSLEQANEEVKRGFGPISLVAMDIDNFKSINDTFGHKAGDTVLKNLVNVLHAERRKLDTVFRTGGEEFVILLRNTSETGARNFAERLRRIVEKSTLLEGHVVTISIGVAEHAIDETEDQWLNRADVCLYKAKNDGRNQVYPPPLAEAFSLV
jgi:diguanylate cyclase (GGDEF)-like protein